MANRPLVLGHRGAPRRARENTLEAFNAARTLGSDGVELDVRRTSDGAAVIHHDPAIEGYGLIVSRPFAELRAERPYVPTLVEALDALAGLFVNIEMKCLPWEPDPDPEGQVAAAVAAAVSERRITQQVVVSSFDLGALGVMRSIDARIPIGWLTYGRPVEQAVAGAVDRGLAWVHPDRAVVLVDPAAATRAAHERALRIAVWTVNEPEDLRALAAAGVDAVITDVPDVAVAAFA